MPPLQAWLIRLRTATWILRRPPLLDMLLIPDNPPFLALLIRALSARPISVRLLRLRMLLLLALPVRALPARPPHLDTRPLPAPLVRAPSARLPQLDMPPLLALLVRAVSMPLPPEVSPLPQSPGARAVIVRPVQVKAPMSFPPPRSRHHIPPVLAR